MSAFRSQLALLCLVLSPAFALAQTAAVTVNAANTVSTVDERHFGANSTIWDGALGSAQTQSLLQAAGIRAVRLPGGSLSDEYHWRTNTNLDHATIAQPWTWSSGFDKSSSLITGLNAQAMITVNYGTGTPEEAAAWVAYANFPTSGGSDVALGTDNPAPGTVALPTPGPYDWQTARTWANLRAATPLTTDDGMNFLRLGRSAPFGFKYWEIGNENYGSWESDLQAPKWDPVTYATRAANYLQLMRAVDPTIKIGVVVETGNQYNGWTASVLGKLATLNARPDFVIYHRYDGAPLQENDAALLGKAANWPADATDLRSQITTAFGATVGATIEIVVTENNSVYSNPGKQSISLVNGLYLADSLASVMQTEIRGVFWWDIRNGPSNANNNAASLYGWRTYGDYGLLSSLPDPDKIFTGAPTTYYETYPTWYAFKLLSLFARAGDSIVSASSNNTLLQVFAAHRADGSYTLLVINKDPANAINGSFTLSGVNVTRANLYAYGKDNDNAAKPNGPGCADITSSTASYTGGSFAQSFPSYSMTVVSLNGPDYPVTTTAPVIVTQPVAVSRTAGSSASFTAEASGCQLPALKWQRAPGGSSTFTDLTDGGAYSGSSTRMLSVSGTTTAMSGDQFRLVATTGVGSANSNAATLTVTAASNGGGNSSGGGGGGGGGAFDLASLVMLAGALLFGRAKRVANH